MLCGAPEPEGGCGVQRRTQAGTRFSAQRSDARLRGGHLLRQDDVPDRDLHGPGLKTREQRAFTALMLRQAFTGRNALRTRPEHDPMAAWANRVERTEAPVEEG